MRKLFVIGVILALAILVILSTLLCDFSDVMDSEGADNMPPQRDATQGKSTLIPSNETLTQSETDLDIQTEPAQAEGSNGHANPEDDFEKSLTDLRAANELYFKQVSDVLPVGLDDEGNEIKRLPEPDVVEVLWKEVPIMDAALHRCIRAAFEAFSDMKVVSEALEGVVRMREVSLGTFDLREGMSNPLPGVDMPRKMKVNDTERLPEVLCWPVDSTGSENIFVLQNSLLRPMIGWGRGLTAPYIVTVTSGGASLSTFPDLGTDVISFMGPYPPPCSYYFLDAIPRENGRPSLVFIYFKIAQNVAIRLIQIDFDPEGDRWSRVSDYRPEGVIIMPDMYYEKETHSFGYFYTKERFGELTRASFSVSDWIHGVVHDNQGSENSLFDEGNRG